MRPPRTFVSTTLVIYDAGRADQETARLEQDGRVAGHGIGPPDSIDVRQPASKVVEVQHRVTGLVGDAETATGVDEPQLDAARHCHPSTQRHRAGNVRLKSACVRHVRGTERVHPEEVDLRRGNRSTSRADQVDLVHAELARALIADEANLLDPVPGEGARPEQDRYPPASSPGDRDQPLELARRLDCQGPDLREDSPLQLVVALAGAGHDDSSGIDAGPHGRLELAGRRDVRAKTEGADVGNDPERGIGLHGVGQLEASRQHGPKRLHLPGDRLEVVRIERRTESRGKDCRIQPAEKAVTEDPAREVRGRRRRDRGHRSDPSSATRASVPASRSFTMIAVARPSPCSAANGPATVRVPATTTAPGGTTSGSSRVPR